ncbi:hypothetical protein VKT23_020221 [Stygiomarasmius scandens]|uniref:C2H2-type domain-containing protein n=1 Tax=Marasmiellus scandens TaxID=2682957 RepID=A0ABR1IJG5_9AGAR
MSKISASISSQRRPALEDKKPSLSKDPYYFNINNLAVPLPGALSEPYHQVGTLSNGVPLPVFAISVTHEERQQFITEGRPIRSLPPRPSRPLIKNSSIRAGSASQPRPTITINTTNTRPPLPPQAVAFSNAHPRNQASIQMPPSGHQDQERLHIQALIQAGLVSGRITPAQVQAALSAFSAPSAPGAQAQVQAQVPQQQQTRIGGSRGNGQTRNGHKARSSNSSKAAAVPGGAGYNNSRNASGHTTNNSFAPMQGSQMGAPSFGLPSPPVDGMANLSLPQFVANRTNQAPAPASFSSFVPAPAAPASSSSFRPAPAPPVAWNTSTPGPSTLSTTSRPRVSTNPANQYAWMNQNQNQYQHQNPQTNYPSPQSSGATTPTLNYASGPSPTLTTSTLPAPSVAPTRGRGRGRGRASTSKTNTSRGVGAGSASTSGSEWEDYRIPTASPLCLWTTQGPSSHSGRCNVDLSTLTLQACIDHIASHKTNTKPIICGWEGCGSSIQPSCFRVHCGTHAGARKRCTGCGVVCSKVKVGHVCSG